jgi:hypothetical protein
MVKVRIDEAFAVYRCACGAEITVNGHFEPDENWLALFVPNEPLVCDCGNKDADKFKCLNVELF